MNIRIRLLQAGEESRVNAIYNHAYGNIRPLSFFEWEFIQGPWGKAIYVIAEDLDHPELKIVGTQCAIPMVFCSTDGKEILTAKSEDTYVDPEYRGQKIFDKMYALLFEECKKQGIAFIWGFTYARKPFLNIGFQIPFESIQGVRVNNIFKAYKYLASLNPANKFLDRLKIFLLCSYGYTVKLISGFSSGNSKGVESDTTIVRNEANERSGNVYWSIDQTIEYSKWRFMDNPYGNSYVQYSSKDKFRLVINNRKEGFSYLEEMTFDFDLSREEKLRNIRESLKMNVKKTNSFLIRYWGFETNLLNREEISLLRKCGFVFIPGKGTGFVWKQLSTNSEITPENLHISRVFTQGNR
ncbi:MAG: GNAT family N-acetyltransferase [Bacteroidetes bacterium]|nr:GNAT family N-acetyltransferase [Bacteroidota bacterium]